MSFAPVITALAIPSEALVERRVPKRLLLEQGAPTVADKRRIQEGIEEMTWVAALKPTNVGVPAFKDECHFVLNSLLAKCLPNLVPSLHDFLEPASQAIYFAWFDA